MTFTNDQQTALDKFSEFINSDCQVFILSGYAGTGKTTLMKTMVESLQSKGGKWSLPYETVLMAPTGRAAVILSGKTGQSAATIHRTIFAIEKGVQYEGKKMKFLLRKNKDSERTVYFVDESSMISDQLSDNDMFKFGSGCLLRDLLMNCGGRKIVFVGDNAQLPPVGQSFSHALDSNHLAHQYQCRVTSSCLREVVRQAADSGIYANATEIRGSIEADSYNEFSIMESSDVRHSVNLFEDYTTEVNSQVDINSIIITYTNALALEYNKRIRNTLFHHTQEPLIKGDLLIISRNNYAYQREPFNGTIVSVAECEEDARMERRKVAFNSKERDEKGNVVKKVYELSFRNVTLELNDGDLLKCKILDSFITDDEGNPGLDISQALYVDFTNRHPGLSRESEEYQEKLKSDPCFNAVICKYGYAITCHKAQGGEWRNVFVDMARKQGKQNSDFFRWAYTAITRSNTNLWVANAPKFNLFSEMQVNHISKGTNFEFYTPEGENFMDYRFKKIRKCCEAVGLNCHESRGTQYQHVIHISDNHGGNCVVGLGV
ncbi:MAG: AAA family ATPase [Bacteroidales bacterium]|nr:AAA family ATPase [Bacteroidales bacterium]